MSAPSYPSIEILLRIDGGPAIGPDGTGSYKCKGDIVLDREGFGPTAIQVRFPRAKEAGKLFPDADAGFPISGDEAETLFLGSLIDRLGAAGATLDSEAEDSLSPVRLDGKPLAFTCSDVMAAQNTALDCLSLAFGGDMAIEIWSVDEDGMTHTLSAGPLVADGAIPSLGAIVCFGCVSTIRDEISGQILDFQEGSTNAAIALSKAEFAEIDKSLPLFVGPLPGARLDAIATLLGERFLKQLKLDPASTGMPVVSWHEWGRSPIIEVNIALPSIEARAVARLNILWAAGGALCILKDGVQLKEVVQFDGTPSSAIDKAALKFNERNRLAVAEWVKNIQNTYVIKP